MKVDPVQEIKGSLRRPTGLMIASALLAAFLIFAATRANGLMQQYAAMYASFGVELSPLTKFVLKTPNFWAMLAVPAVFIFGWIAMKSEVTPRERRHMKAAFIASLVLDGVVYGLVAFALYEPIIRFGQAV
jgi:hypothetical protein